jgi:hypothetical protein
MVTDQQVKKLMNLIKTEKTSAVAAMKAGMDEKTARKYRDLGKLPSQCKQERTWRTREDPFEEVWPGLRSMLKVNSGLQAKTLFDYLQKKYPGRFQDGQRRTLERRVKVWRALEGPSKEVYFPQEHHPGELSASDFTNMNGLDVTIGGQAFPHLLYHFVLTYSNWETGTVCYSESFESFSEGLQNGLWELGGVTAAHRTDRLSAAVNNNCNPEEFTKRYEALLRHYRLEGQKTQTGKGNENGDVEKSHDLFKTAIDQALMLRGSRNFESRKAYETFLRQVFAQLNAGRTERLQEELKVLRELPERRLNDYKRLEATVRSSSTILVQHNVYSVESRLIGEKVRIYLYAEQFEVWYAQRLIEKIPRLRGEGKHRICYRHIIDWLVRKPGAFENYRYRDDLFPTHRFRMAYDVLKKESPKRASREYLQILSLAAKESETGVNEALRVLFDKEEQITAQGVKELLKSGEELSRPTDVTIEQIDLAAYDELIHQAEENEEEAA